MIISYQTERDPGITVSALNQLANHPSSSCAILSAVFNFIFTTLCFFSLLRRFGNFFIFIHALQRVANLALLLVHASNMRVQVGRQRWGRRGTFSGLLRVHGEQFGALRKSYHCGVVFPFIRIWLPCGRRSGEGISLGFFLTKHPHQR